MSNKNWYYNAHAECPKDKTNLTRMEDGSSHYLCTACGKRFKLEIKPTEKPSFLESLFG